jgi:transcriptional regulator with XRE-family HTH domain
MNMALQIDETVAHNLKLIRIRNHMTQQALADRANLSKQTISNLEKGQGATSKTIERLAECLDVSPLTFYQKISEQDDIQFKRVSTTGTSSTYPLSYVNELKGIVNRIISDTKDLIYYQNVSPVIRNYFNTNADSILNNLNTEINSKNYHILSAVEETLMSSIKQAIFNTDEELDELIEE